MNENLQKLYNAIEAKDAEQVEITLSKCFELGLSQEFVPALVELSEEVGTIATKILFPSCKA